MSPKKAAEGAHDRTTSSRKKAGNRSKTGRARFRNVTNPARAGTNPPRPVWAETNPAPSGTNWRDVTAGFAGRLCALFQTFASPRHRQHAVLDRAEFLEGFLDHRLVPGKEFIRSSSVEVAEGWLVQGGLHRSPSSQSRAAESGALKCRRRPSETVS